MFRKQLELRIQWFVIALVAIYLVLSLVTALLEGWSPLDGFYFGMATLTTLGYGDYEPQTTVGKLLVTFLAPLGIIMVFGIGFLMLQIRVQRMINRRVASMVDSSLENHIIVCGYGKIGQVVVRTLRRMGKTVCVVEQDLGKEARLQQAEISYVIGDAMDQGSLESARIETAAVVVVTLDNDANNVYVVLEARDLRKDIKIISTSSSADAARRAVLAGAERVVSPAAIAGEMLAKSALNPDVMDFLSEVSESSGSSASLSQVAVEKGSWISGRTLKEIGTRLPGVRIVVTRMGPETNIAPGGQIVVKPGMVLLVVGSHDEIELMHAESEPAS